MCTISPSRQLLVSSLMVFLLQLLLLLHHHPTVVAFDEIERKHEDPSLASSDVFHSTTIKSVEDLVYDSFNNLFDSMQRTYGFMKDEYRHVTQNDSKSALSNWIAYHELLKPINRAILDRLFPVISDAAIGAEDGKGLNLTNDCMVTLFDFAQAIDQQQTWAYRLLDSSGNIFPSGFMSGSFSHMGDFDQCLETVGPSFTEDNDQDSPIRGQYCLLKYNLYVPTNKSRLLSQDRVFNTSGTRLQNTFFSHILKYGHVLKVRSGKIGICLPSTCTRDDIQSLVDFFLSLDKISTLVDSCQTANDFGNFSTLQISIFATLGSLVVLVLIATIVELSRASTSSSSISSSKPKLPLYTSMQEKESILLDVLLKFSAPSNIRSLLNSDSRSFVGAGENFRSINGIRVLTMCWLVYAHAYFLSIKETFRSSSKFIESIYDLKMYFILNAWPAVEVFFIISALLHSYHVFQTIFNVRKINIIKLIINRIARLWPNLWLTIALAFAVPGLAQGPLWIDVMRQQVHNCYRTWWKVPLFVSNIRSSDETCQIHTWYLSVDTQLFVASFIFIFLFYKLKKKAIYLTVALAVLICSLISLYFYKSNLVPTILFNNVEERQIYEDMSIVYMPTYYHLTPYLVGIVTGYVLMRSRESGIKVYKPLNIFLWFFCGLVTISVILSGYILTASTETSLVNQSVYAGYHRLLWSSAVSYLIFACENKQGGIINGILSHRVFVPFSKLSYLVYLIHFIVTWARSGYQRTQLVYSNYTLLNEFIVNLVYSLVLSFVFYLLVEAPFHKLYSSYIGKRNWCFGEISFEENEEDHEEDAENNDINKNEKNINV